MTRTVTKVEMPHALHGDLPASINADIDALRDMYRQSPGLVAMSDEKVLEELLYNSTGSECIVVYDKTAQGRELEGFVQFRVEEEEQYVNIDNLYVSSDKRKSGVGRALVARVIDEARSKGIDEVSLYAKATAVDFYTKMGFSVVDSSYDSDGIYMPLMTLSSEIVSE